MAAKKKASKTTAPVRTVQVFNDAPPTIAESHAAAVAETDDRATMASLMEQMAALTKRVQTAETENDRLARALEDAAKTGEYTDEAGQVVRILDPAMNSVNASIHDRPGTIAEKLDAMERLGKLNRQPFNRERTRAILMGEEVPDLVDYICPHCGRAEEKWNDKVELFDAHLEHHRTGGRRAAYPSRKNIRAIDDLVDAG